ncbi:hypothetical protein DNTS_024901 [Danionella cerebrum]|uniref:Centrosomal protein kizuna n=1 Tax=Danionella cerebrum TaxID=2873325 RepID=A0A553QSC0_9TELE|nr:hypothetical protein DNTS_024901 [Danionella translucida]
MSSEQQPVMAFYKTEYFDQIENIQKTIHERMKLKHVKMSCYYKELLDREQRAKTRNHELLGSVEELDFKLKEFSVDWTRLLQKRMDYKNHIWSQKKARGETVDKLRGLSSPELSQRAEVVKTVHQTSLCSSKNDIITSSASLKEPEPNHPSHSPPQSALCMHSWISKVSHTAILSDDIPNSADFLEGGRLNDRQIETDWDIKSPHTVLKEVEVSSRSATSKTPADIVSSEQRLTHSPSPDATDPGGSSESFISGAEEKEESAENEAHAVPIHKDFSGLAVHRSGDLSPSHSHSGHRTLRTKSGIQASLGGGTQRITQSSGGPESHKRLSVNAFLNLLESIQQRLNTGDVNPYRSTVVEQEHIDDIIRLCSAQQGHLDALDLNACAAVLLQQLPLISCSMDHGCLLPRDLILSLISSAAKPEHISSCLSSESALLWDGCFQHFLKLQMLRILSTDNIIQMFTPLLLPAHASYLRQTEELLKRLLSQESHQPSESDVSSSGSLPSVLEDSVEIKAARPSRLNAVEEGIQSSEEDSADQSPIMGVPFSRLEHCERLIKVNQRLKSHLKSGAVPLIIQPQGSAESEDLRAALIVRRPGRGRRTRSRLQRADVCSSNIGLWKAGRPETRAYQLLKQSVAQERRWSDTEEERSEPADYKGARSPNATRNSRDDWPREGDNDGTLTELSDACHILPNEQLH